MKNKLLDNIREKAEKEHREILEKAHSEADSILDNAHRTSEDLREQTRLKIQAEASRLCENKYNALQFQLNARKYEVQSSALNSIWCEVGEILRKIEQYGDFAAVLEHLFYECLSEVPDGSVVKASGRYAGTVRACIAKSERRLTFEEDNRIIGGIEFHWADGKIVVRNTLSHRLSKLKAEGNAEISSMLFPSVEDSKE